MEGLFISLTQTIRSAMSAINRGQKGIVLVVDKNQRLIGTITDGDIRRAILAGLNLETPLNALLERKAGTRYERPIVATDGISENELLRLMRANDINVVPIVDDYGRVIRVVSIDSLVDESKQPVQAVVMAGGFGKRLHPLTVDTPKPMLRIGGRPVLEHIIEQLRTAGISTINITTHFLGETIRKHFGTGTNFGVALNYVSEDQPLGTAGSLSLVEDTSEPLLVINGDILTEVDFRALIAFHRENQAQLTVAVRQYEMEVPYGVIEASHGRVTGLREKPKLSFLVNAGIYLLEPSARKHIPDRQRFDMTDLITQLLKAGIPVVCFPVVEYWLDIGQHKDLARAQQDVLTMRRAA